MKRTTIFLFFIFTSFVYGQNDALQLHQKLRGWVTLGAGFSFPHGMNIDAGATCVLNNKHAFQL